MGLPRTTGRFSLMWWCASCERALENDGKHHEQSTGLLGMDTVTMELAEPVVVRHDGCGGLVAFSARSAAKT